MAQFVIAKIWIAMLAYLADVFNILKTLNLSLQFSCFSLTMVFVVVFVNNNNTTTV